MNTERAELLARSARLREMPCSGDGWDTSVATAYANRSGGDRAETMQALAAAEFLQQRRICGQGDSSSHGGGRHIAAAFFDDAQNQRRRACEGSRRLYEFHVVRRSQSPETDSSGHWRELRVKASLFYYRHGYGRRKNYAVGAVVRGARCGVLEADPDGHARRLRPRDG